MQKYEKNAKVCKIVHNHIRKIYIHILSICKGMQKFTKVHKKYTFGHVPL